MKYVVITGSTKGIGRAIGERFLQCGYGVIFNYFSDDIAANNLRQSLSEYSGKFEIIKQELSSIDDVKAFAESCKKITQSISAIILNAGITDRTKWEDMTWEKWNNVMNVNLNAPVFLAQTLGVNIENGGNIIFIGSAMGQYPHAMSVPYGVSKAALHFLSQSLVKEYQDRGIRVNTVAPGFVETPWQKDKPQEQRKRITDKIALERFATSEEVADAVWFIFKNGYMNGTVLDINGGYLYK